MYDEYVEPSIKYRVYDVNVQSERYVDKDEVVILIKNDCLDIRSRGGKVSFTDCLGELLFTEKLLLNDHIYERIVY